MLGLQRLVGNQAVLRILATEISARAPDAKKAGRLAQGLGRLRNVVRSCFKTSDHLSGVAAGSSRPKWPRKAASTA